MTLDTGGLPVFIYFPLLVDVCAPAAEAVALEPCWVAPEAAEPRVEVTFFKIEDGELDPTLFVTPLNGLLDEPEEALGEP
jgi:hypothetical protein